MEAGGGLVRLLRTRGETDWLLQEVDSVLRILGWENMRVVTAQTFFERLLGLLAPVYGAGMRADGVAIVFPCCSSVHTWFMKRDLDIVFLDRKGAMLRVYWDVKPGRLIFCPGASLAIERVSTKEFPGQEQKARACLAIAESQDRHFSKKVGFCRLTPIFDLV